MQWLDDLKEKLVPEVRVKKVGVRDIQRNIRAIEDRTKLIHDEIDKVTNQMSQIDQNDAKSRDKYLQLESELAAQNGILTTLQTELKSEYEILKKYRDSRFTIQPERGLIIGGILFLGTFMIALERENPKALKLAQFLLRLFPLHL